MAMEGRSIYQQQYECIVHTFELSMSHLFVYRKLRQYAAALVVGTVRPSVKIYNRIASPTAGCGDGLASQTTNFGHPRSAHIGQTSIEGKWLTVVEGVSLCALAISSHRG